MPTDSALGAPRGKLAAGDFHRKLLCHVLPHGADHRAAFAPEFWHGALGNIMPGDRIEVCSGDREIMFEIIVLVCNPHSNPPRLGIGFRPIWPLDLPLPQGVVGNSSKYRTRQDSGGFYQIYTVTAGRDELLMSAIASFTAAGEAISSLERRDAEAAAAVSPEAAAVSPGVAAVTPLMPKRPRGRPRKVARARQAGIETVVDIAARSADNA